MQTNNDWYKFNISIHELLATLIVEVLVKNNCIKPGGLKLKQRDIYWCDI